MYIVHSTDVKTTQPKQEPKFCDIFETKDEAKAKIKAWRAGADWNKDQTYVYTINKVH